MAGLDANTRIVETRQIRQRLREESGLHLLCNFQLLGGAPFNFQLLGNCAALPFDLAAHLVGGDQFKGVSINIGEGGKGPAPKLLLRRLGKMHSAAAPQLISCIDVLSDKANVRWPPDKLVVLRTALGRKQGKNCAAIRGRDRDPAAKLKAAVGQHAESKLVHVKLQAPVVIANVDVRFEDA